MKAVLYKYDPAVHSSRLLLLAGVVWAAAGMFLCIRAADWLAPLPGATAALLVATGAIVAIVSSRFMFRRIAHRNVERISRLPERACMFAFSAWRGYGIIGVMILLGIVLRSSLPGQYLVLPYFAMGGTLLLSSSVFFRSYWNRRHLLTEISQIT
ncbi:MAG: hypothetical protein KF749_14325 [Bacteroidetes bacterium]|nr:hypothetical protein [Bacteroidota bacterium]MCW5894095.1 hypothetical protein [Bacteroidota bacterium]